MNKKTFKWCGPRQWVSGPATNIKIESTDYSEGCLNWTCQCKHSKHSHHWLDDRCYNCNCQNFKYLNNDNCTVECQILWKLYEQE